MRKEFWGYAPDENLAPDELIGEPYRGIRPAPGYPAQPDHTEKVTLFKLLDGEGNAGVSLTESMAMWPGSSVSGIYLSHPESYYFGVAKVERDQVEDYARRKGMRGGRRRALARADPQLYSRAVGRSRGVVAQRAAIPSPRRGGLPVCVPMPADGLAGALRGPAFRGQSVMMASIGMSCGCG